MQKLRVFKDEIGKWPKVYQTGPGRFEVVARHTDPNWVKNMILLSNLPPAVFVYYLLPGINPSNWGFVVAGIVAGWMVIYRVARFILTDLPFLTKRTLRVIFDNGEIRWGKFKILADAPRQFRSGLHRRGPANAQQLRQESDRTAVPTYKLASEVFIDSGEGWMHPRVVAEIAKDEFGEWAHLLATTLRFVDKRAQAGVATDAWVNVRVSID